MIEIPSYEIYGTRMLAFLETGAQSNKYRQVVLTAEEFKKFSFSIGKIVEVNGDDSVVELQLSEDVYDLPDLQEHL